MNNFVFYLEGSDSTGKTTLANQICKDLNAKYVHCSWSSEIDTHFLVDYLKKKWIEVLELSLYSNVVLDRHVLSTIIYENIYRDGLIERSDLKDFAIKVIDTMKNSKRIIPIICTLPFEEWKDLFIKNQQESGKIEMYQMDSKLEEVFHSYEKLIKFKSIDWFPVHLNFKVHDFKKNPFSLNDYM